ncbi:Gfo/Idh/MocA family oxidoreductase [Kiritimatiellaeota bacterium B1221]|nr:Gfo/Idh/MocA family oxidoreductase [Kiritimatiellaeota bacterium B1221]
MSKQKSEIQIGFIGAGLWGRIKHLPSLRLIAENKLDGLEPVLAHLIEFDPEHRRKVKAEWGFLRASDSIEALAADTELDALVVAINPARLQAVLPVLAATGKPVFCEKPPGNNSDDAAAYARLIPQTNLVAFNRRFHPLVQRLHAELQNCEIHCFQAQMLRHGRLDSFKSRENPMEPPFFKVTGIHLINTLDYLLGDVSLVEVRKLETRPGVTDGRMTLMQTVRGQVQGQVAVLPTCGRNEEMIEVHSPEKSFRLRIYQDAPSVLEIFHKGRLEETVVDDPERSDLWNHGYVYEHLAFLKAVREGGGTISNFQNAVHSLKISEALEAAVPCA